MFSFIIGLGLLHFCWSFLLLLLLLFPKDGGRTWWCRGWDGSPARRSNLADGPRRRRASCTRRVSRSSSWRRRPAAPAPAPASVRCLLQIKNRPATAKQSTIESTGRPPEKKNKATRRPSSWRDDFCFQGPPPDGTTSRPRNSTQLGNYSETR